VSQLGTKLKEARRELGLSVEEAAAETGTFPYFSTGNKQLRYWILMVNYSS